jgi:CheY-like chemotaxis protein
MSLKIMVVDDEPLSQKLIRSLAAPSGHTVLTFEDSQEAGQRAETQRFDVTFVGMRTPQLDGLELARRIRNSPLNLETTIVMLSATDDWTPLGGKAEGTRPVCRSLRKSCARGINSSFPCAA